MNQSDKMTSAKPIQWQKACLVEEAVANGGVCVKYGEKQIAVFYFTRRNEWYATQNDCPHKKQMALSRGMIGTHEDEPKIACPFHKKTFSLIDGHCMNDETCEGIKTYPVKVENDQVYIEIEIPEAVDGI